MGPLGRLPPVLDVLDDHVDLDGAALGLGGQFMAQPVLDVLRQYVAQLQFDPASRNDEIALPELLARSREERIH